ncbi:MAG: HigA family addiction module antitoxin [Pirellulales bacterium]
MTTIAPRPYSPDIAISPGETIREVLEHEGMTQAELAKRMGRPINKINEVIQGKRQITADTALELELALGLPASFWINLEKNYQLTKARLTQKKRLDRESTHLASFPVKEMCRLGWLKKMSDKADQAHEILSFFGVTSFSMIKKVKSLAPVWRKTRTKKACEYALASWLQRGIRLSHEIETEDFDPTGLKSNINELRALTVQNPEVFEPALKTICAQYGVAVVFVPHLPKSYASGAAYRLYDKVVIQLSLRHQWADIFWFNFFHELGHVLLHLTKRKGVFVDDKDFTVESEDLEVEANDFAAMTLIPTDDFESLASRAFSRAAVVQAFANEIGIASGIVVGRLHHEGLVPRNRLVSLRCQYTWRDEDVE